MRNNVVLYRLCSVAALCCGIAASALSPAHGLMVYGPQGYNPINDANEYSRIGLEHAGIWTIPTQDGSPRLNADGSYFAEAMAWPISPNWALIANHVGVIPGGKIFHNGVLHEVQSQTYVGGDLKLVRVASTFSSYALMYDPTQDGGSEVGMETVVFGRSTAMKDVNSPITTNNGTFLNGWNPTSFPYEGLGKANWGRNRIEGILPNVLNSEVIYTTFDGATLPDGSPNPRHIGPDEVAAYNGDSGGAMFVKQNGQWRIAGSIYAVSAFYREQNTPWQDFTYGAIIDGRNLWADFYVDENNPSAGTVRRMVTDTEPVPSAIYAARVAAYRTNIDRITGQTAGLGAFTVPEAGTLPMVLGGVGCWVLGAITVRRCRNR